MNQSQFQAITCNSLEAREKSRVHGAIGFGFASHWLKNWRDSFKPIAKRSNRNHVFTFDSHLKSALWKSFYCSLSWQIWRMDIDGWLPGDLAARGVSYMTAELYWEDKEQKQKKTKKTPLFSTLLTKVRNTVF